MNFNNLINLIGKVIFIAYSYEGRLAYNTVYAYKKGGISMFTYSSGYATQQLHFVSPRQSVSWELVLILFIVLVLLGQVLYLF